MGKRRRDRDDRWVDWLLSVLLGMGLALLCILWLGGRSARNTPAAAPENPPSVTAAEAGRSLGFEFTLRFRILLPEHQAG